MHTIIAIRRRALGRQLIAGVDVIPHACRARQVFVTCVVQTAYRPSVRDTSTTRVHHHMISDDGVTASSTD